MNIATMDVGRKAEGGEALMCLTVDTEVPSEVLDQVAAEIEAHQLRTVTLPPERATADGADAVVW